MTIPGNPKPGDRWMTNDGATGTWIVWRAGETSADGFRFDAVHSMGLSADDARLLVYGPEAVAMLRELESAGWDEVYHEPCCPDCGELPRIGHTEYCRLAAVLKSLEGT